MSTNKNRFALTQEILVAFVDRELPAHHVAIVEAGLADDTQAQEIVRKLRVSARIANEVSLDALNEPLPLRLVTAARGTDRRMPPTAMKPPGRSKVSRRLPALAVGIASLAIGLAGGYLIRDPSPEYAASVDPLEASYEATLQASLDSGAMPGQSFTYGNAGLGQGKITLGDSFTTQYKQPCREFSREENLGGAHSAGQGLACRAENGRWSFLFFRDAS